ncbi:nicotinate-nucleotide adenylyltransferase [Pullulanibacillus sp. KACC 23026]|uniref:nicotinate-nucleotide adenylyltransferase n=1 Tax=Pullulanibacillus sp. KACC 23026 TaxID=3028315 RepID=UPI0023AEEB39|nr:nicotinate-nucleotide adenylyltransferase [Pullulanibacillus sp. KACC 23026]WEG14204.1 nicotinate-nucleotide adenylyltransferase [Pullulanibacillus sp. KACC 23026]
MRIGLLGGTFDPPHFGHLIMAEEARAAFELDEVWFMPTYLPPHKERRVTKAEQRIDMVRRAISGNPYFKLSLVEYERKGRSYTYETIEILKEQHPDVAFYFIIGGDMVNDLPNWYRIEELKKEVSFIGVTRSHVEIEKAEQSALQLIKMPDIDISSTMIRERIQNKQPVRYFLPENVRNYIEENQLYD